MKFIAAISIFLGGCAVNSEGDAYVQTPKISVPIPKVGINFWAYGIAGISRIDPDHETLGK